MSIQLDMPGTEYAELDALSAAFLRDMLATTPLQAKLLKEQGRPDSEAKAFGRAVHCCVLEPERFERELAVMPAFEGKGSRALRAEWELRNAGKIQLKPKVIEQLLAMRDAVMRDQVAGQMFEDPGHNEASAVWDDPLGMRCKVRFDRLFSSANRWGVALLDLKSTRNAQEGFFRYDMAQYGYDVEACFYLRALDMIYDVRERPFYFVAVEKVPPYKVEVHRLLPSEHGTGTLKMQRAMAMYAHCRKTGEWPDVPLFTAQERSA